MRYRLTTPPTIGPGKVTEELDRLLKNARRLTISLVVVSPPYKKLPMAATVLEVPDPFAQMATRVLEVIQGPNGQSEPQLAVPMRDEWTKHALLLPRKGAQPLVESLFDGWSSACLHLAWRPGHCVGLVHYCAGDAARVAALAGHGWCVRSAPVKLAGPLAALFLGLTWTSRVSHQPFLGRPLITPTAQAGAPSGGRRMSAPTLFSEPQESVFAHGSTGGSRQSRRPLAVGTVLAPRGADGFPLGTTRDGRAVKLAWHALVMSAIADETRQRDLALTMINRAIQHNVGQIVVIPPSFVTSRQIDSWSRVRTLDPRNLWQTHAIPWHLIEPALLSQALAAAGVQASITGQLPRTFGEFLAGLPGGDRYRSESVLILTAPEGDDLRGVVSAGGCVLLVDDGAPGSRLLTMLLVALLASDPPTDRRMLIIRPAALPVPAALADRAIQMVLGEDPTALGTLSAGPDSWRLTHADGSAAVELDADLDRPPSALDESNYGTLLDTLAGKRKEATGAPAAEPPLVSLAPADASQGGDLAGRAGAALVTHAPAAPAADDDLFRSSLDLTAPFAAPRQAQPPAASARSSRFTFDSPWPNAGSSAPVTPGGLRDAAQLTALSAAALDEEQPHEPAWAGAGAGPGDDDGLGLADVLAQPLSALSLSDTGWPLGQQPPAIPAAGEGSGDDLRFDLFAAPLDLGSSPAAAVEPPASGRYGPDVGSIFPPIGADPFWQGGLPPTLGAPDDLVLPDLPPDTAAPAGDGQASAGLFYLPFKAGPEDESRNAPSIAPRSAGWSAGPGVVESWAERPWLPGEPLADAPPVSSGEATPSADVRVGDSPAAASAAGPAAPARTLLPADAAPGVDGEPGAPEPHVRGAETIRGKGHRWRLSRDRRDRHPLYRRAVRADAPRDSAADASASDAAAHELEREPDAVPALDAVTLALAAGDIDLAAVPAFDGPEFELPPMDAAGLSDAADSAASVTVAPAAEDNAAHTRLPQPSDADTARTAMPAPMSGGAERVLTDSQVIPLVSDGQQELDRGEPGAMVVVEEPALPLAAAPVPQAAAPVSVAAVPVFVSWAPTIDGPRASGAPADLAINASAIYAAWGAGAGMADLVTLVARANPSADRLHIRRTIRALLDARAASSPPQPAVPAMPLWSAGVVPAVGAFGSGGVPAAAAAVAAEPWATVEADAPAAALSRTVTDPPFVAQQAGNARAADAPAPTPLAEQLVDTAAIAPAGAISGDREPSDEAALVADEPVAGAPAPAAVEAASELLIGAPASAAAVVDSVRPLDNVVSGAQAPVVTEMSAAHVAAPEAADSCPAGVRERVAGHLSDDAIWARWMAGDDLHELIRAICGYIRGHAADEARDRVYRVVAPRIVAELNADMLMTRLRNGRNPLPSQVALLDELLKRMNRQSTAPVGIARAKTQERLLASLAEARDTAGVTAA